MSSSVVSINGFKLEPSALCTINKVYNRLENNTAISAYFNISLSFTLVSDRGSPRSKIDTSISNTGWGGPQNYFWTNTGLAPVETITADQKLAAVIRKQEALRKLFEGKEGEGHHLEIQSADGSFPLKAQVTLQDITFSESIWVQTVSTSIVLRASKITVFGEAYDEDLFGEKPYLIESLSETWNFETDETPESQYLPRTYRTTHNLTCKGINKFDDGSPPTLVSPAWKQARIAVLTGVYVGGPSELSVIGYDSSLVPLSGVRDLPSYYVRSNHLRTENIDKSAGTYQVSESWLLSSGRSLFDWTIQKQDEINSPTISVSINGTITGLDERDETNLSLISSKFTNADVRLSGEVGNFHSYCQSYGGVSLNPIPTTKTVGKNPNTGIINVDYGFDNRPRNYLNGGSGIRTENITIGYSRQGDVHAEIFVLGRPGPVIQDLSAKTARKKTLNINAILNPQDTLSPTFPDISDILNAVKPTGTIVMNDPPEENLDLKGQYSYSTSWVYE